MNNIIVSYQATEHFTKARNTARRRQWISRLTGRDYHLLPFNEIRALLRHQNPLYRGTQQIQLDKIAGSVGRVQDFDRHFSPLKDSMQNRWVKVETMAMMAGWPPIEAYEAGGVYFVADGHHRVAVASQMGLSTIEANVWEFPEDLQIGLDDSLDEVLLLLEEQRFQAETNLDQLRPNHHIRFTTPGRYAELQAQIANMGEKLAIIDGGHPTQEEMITAWYDLDYFPTVQIIRDTEMLAAFPGRTEADLFVWLSAHRQELNQRYGTHQHLHELAASLAGQYGESKPAYWWRRLKQRLGNHTSPALMSPNYAYPHLS